MERVKEIDFAGRIVIPAEMRKILNIKTNDQLHIATDGNRLIIEKKQDACAICGGTEALVQIGQKHICEQCYRYLFSGGIQIKVACKEKKCTY
ncbi:hypothetical protein IMSAG013_00820 [Clostridiales bacterium]|nr:hypothetical protein IMSAG013_00820 [Clostridiales bacterium]